MTLTDTAAYCVSSARVVTNRRRKYRFCIFTGRRKDCGKLLFIFLFTNGGLFCTEQMFVRCPV